MKEVFKSIKGYEGIYQVNNLGNIKSLERVNTIGRTVKERILKASVNSSGYLTVTLCKNGKPKTRTVHQIVAESFLGHKPNGHKLVINHINFIKTDNRAVNLEIVTNRENSNKKHLKSSSRFTGVYWYKNYKKWMSTIHINGKRKHLGYFTNELEASNAYQTALKSIQNVYQTKN